MYLRPHYMQSSGCFSNIIITQLAVTDSYTCVNIVSDMYCTLFVILLANIGHSSGREFIDKLDRYIIACHTTDFECFKRQYKALRDNVLQGNELLNIPTHDHYIFEYGNGTCVKLSGLDESELIAVNYSSHSKRFAMTLALPIRIHQVQNLSKLCAKPDHEFTNIKPQNGSLMRFTGNATIEVSYPTRLRKSKQQVYMKLGEEDLDVILDIPDLSHFDMTSEVELKLFEWSEWAYEVVQHVDAAQYFALPYTTQMRTLMDHLPLHRLLLLYPDEDYLDLEFSYKPTP